MTLSMQTLSQILSGATFGGSAYAVLRIQPDETTPMGLILFCAACIVPTGAIIHKGLKRPKK